MCFHILYLHDLEERNVFTMLKVKPFVADLINMTVVD